MNVTAARLDGSGLAIPTRYEQPTGGGRRSPAVGEIFFDPGTINIRPPTHRYVAESMATPATCPAFATDRPPLQALNARAWLSQLILDRAWPQDASGRDPRIAAWEKRTPISDQDRWARATFAGLRACALSDIDVPLGQ